jgi:hypothetical protein
MSTNMFINSIHACIIKDKAYIYLIVIGNKNKVISWEASIKYSDNIDLLLDKKIYEYGADNAWYININNERHRMIYSLIAIRNNIQYRCIVPYIDMNVVIALTPLKMWYNPIDDNVVCMYDKQIILLYKTTLDFNINRDIITLFKWHTKVYEETFYTLMNKVVYIG